MPSTRQEKEFAAKIKDHVDEVTISQSALDDAIEYISREFEPDDVFTEKQLTDWAERNGFIKE